MNLIFVLPCVHAKSYSLQPIDCSPPGCSVPEILQTRILEWIAMPSFRGSSQPRNWTRVSCLLHWKAGSLPLVLPWRPLLCSCPLPSKFIFWRLIYNVMVFWDGVFGRKLAHESRALKNKIRTLTRRDMREMISPHHVRTQREENCTPRTRTLSKNPVSPHLGLGLLSLLNFEK